MSYGDVDRMSKTCNQIEIELGFPTKFREMENVIWGSYDLFGC